MIQNFIRVRTEFEGFHRYEKAPTEVKFLRNFHRHKFFVSMIVPVDHTERDVEFFILKAQLTDFIDQNYRLQETEKSCEVMANEILQKFHAREVEVSEDNENSGIVVDTTAIPAIE